MLAVFVSSLVWAASPPPPIVGGDTTRQHDAVGAFVASSDELWGAFCSGTLIGGSAVLTAGHCVDAMVEYDRAGFEISFATGTDLSRSGGVDTSTLVSSAVAHPDYASVPLLQADIAVARLVESVRGVDPVPLNDSAPTRRAWGFDTLTHVGWGADNDDGTGGGIKREVELDYLDFDGDFLYSYAEDGSNVCVGDSGGAALGQTDDGEWVLVGVNAFVFDLEMGEPRCEGGASGATRVDAFLDFIDAAVGDEEEDEEAGWSSFDIEGGSGNGTIQETKSGCAVTTGAGTLALAGLSLLAVAARRRDEPSGARVGNPGLR